MHNTKLKLSSFLKEPILAFISDKENLVFANKLILQNS